MHFLSLDFLEVLPAMEIHRIPLVNHMLINPTWILSFMTQALLQVNVGPALVSLPVLYPVCTIRLLR